MKKLYNITPKILKQLISEATIKSLIETNVKLGDEENIYPRGNKIIVGNEVAPMMLHKEDKPVNWGKILQKQIDSLREQGYPEEKIQRMIAQFKRNYPELHESLIVDSTDIDMTEPETTNDYDFEMPEKKGLVLDDKSYDTLMSMVETNDVERPSQGVYTFHIGNVIITITSDKTATIESENSEDEPTNIIWDEKLDEIYSSISNELLHEMIMYFNKTII